MIKLKSKPMLRTKPFSDVYISTGNGLIKKVLQKGFDELGGVSKFVKPGQTVLIKPNLTAGEDPITGGTTDVRLLTALVEILQEQCEGVKLYCGENTDVGDFTMNTYDRLGYTDICRRYGVELVDFTNTERVDISLEDAMYADVMPFPKIVLDVDVFITLPLLKNHDTVCVTAAIKNSFGLVPDEMRRQTHRDYAIEQCLVDISRVRKPDFSIVDGRIGMEGIAGGSHFDHPRYANRIVMGADPVAVDVVCAHIMAQNPRVRYLQWADEYNLGNCNLDYINIHGMPLKDAVVPFMTPAEEIEETTDGKIRLYDLDSCSHCRAVAQGILHRFKSGESVLKGVNIIYGPGKLDDSIEPGDRLLVGNCVREEYRSSGVYIPGCPMNRQDYFEALTSMNIVCSICEQEVLEFIERHTPEELAFLRILASNKTVFKGALNNAGPTDFLLAVGDCQKYYLRHHLDRSKNEIKQRGLEDLTTADFFVKFIPGHDVTQEDLEAALSELKERYAGWRT